MNKWFACILLAGLAACGDKASEGVPPESDVVRQFVGTTHRDTLPTGLERKGWIYLDSLGGHDYAVTPVADGKRRMFWLDESDPVAGWKVVAALGYDLLPNGYELSLGKCSGHELQPTELAALVYRDQPRAAARIVKAWHVNRKTKTFEEIRPAGVVCP